MQKKTPYKVKKVYSLAAQNMDSDIGLFTTHRAAAKASRRLKDIYSLDTVVLTRNAWVHADDYIETYVGD